jgi:hypothetical protein
VDFDILRYGLSGKGAIGFVGCVWKLQVDEIDKIKVEAL